MTTWKVCVRALVVFVFIIAVTHIVLSDRAVSQDGPMLHDPNGPGHFYSHACCNLKDCRPAIDGEISMTFEGYRVRIAEYGIDEIVPVNDKKVKMSEDGRFHHCVGGLFGKNPKPYVRCLYIPLSG